MQVVVLAGGQSPERNVSLVTGKAVHNALVDLGHQVTVVDPDASLPQVLWQHKQAGCEFIWIALHGPGGEDGTVQAMLDWLGLPYQGSGALASALAMDKWVTKQIWQAADLATPAWLGWRPGDQLTWTEAAPQLGTPVVIKPVSGGSTFGITIARDAVSFEAGLALAAQYSERVIVEQFIPGTEITASVLDGLALPLIEIIPAQGDFYDYEAKYAPGGCRHLLPPRLSEAAQTAIQALSVAAYTALHCQGLARADLRLDATGQPWLLEMNTLPGMTPTSLCPDAAAALGWTFSDLVAKQVTQGLRRFQQQPLTVAS